MEITPEANQSALNALVREILPDGWQIVKGPAIHREQKRVAVTLTPSFLRAGPGPSPKKGGGEHNPPLPESGEGLGVRETFLAATGWQLDLTLAAQPAAAQSTCKTSEFLENSEVCDAKTGARMEINTAYSHIKTALEGSSLYRTSLKGDEIILSFISRQVAERHQDKINALVEQTGWPLSINPQPNHGAILEIARALLDKSGLTIAKGPSIYPEKADVAVTLAVTSAEPDLADITEAFTAQTGFRLVVTTPSGKSTEHAPRNMSLDVVEIPSNRIRLNSHQQSLSLDPAKLQKAIERARLMGITPPIQVRRVRDGYVLSDGLYRLRAAEALGLERIPALVE
ncbi:MAG: ParB/RepB/Spo0J family partition protein [Chloroflexi bacterium]|nr:ParB/RepB/Spo0J family partition protein [Chloroflexota bacterium]